MKKVIVIGAGAAGLMAAVAAADAGADVLILEKNEKAGKKIYITGKGRCNFTNACETQDFFGHVMRNPKFLYSAVYDFDQQQMINFLEENGCPTKVERGNRAFPVSDHASDVTRALTGHLQRQHVRIRLHAEVKRILTVPLAQSSRETGNQAQDPSEGSADTRTQPMRDRRSVHRQQAEQQVVGVLLSNGEKIEGDAVILATGGLSYSSTGSTGDGYRFARELGMDVKPCAPSLVPLVVRERWPLELQGLSLRNVSVTLTPAQKVTRPVYTGFGEMMFTHFGVTGPLILTASCCTDFEACPEGYVLHLDLKPALTAEQLEERIHREFTLSGHKEYAHAIRPLFPARLAEMVARLFAEQETDSEEAARAFMTRKAYTLNDAEIRQLAALVKDVTMTVTGTRGWNEAIVTRGGIAVNEINPSTMEARKVKGLFVAGEVIDVDAQTGGFNLQIAWSTGHLAGTSAAGEVWK